MSNDNILEKLHAGVTTVSFIKANGERRDMECTLHESYLPARTSTAAPKAPNPDVQPVWDINANAWRAFRWDRVIEDE